MSIKGKKLAVVIRVLLFVFFVGVYCRKLFLAPWDCFDRGTEKGIQRLAAERVRACRADYFCRFIPVHAGAETVLSDSDYPGGGAAEGKGNGDQDPAGR